jgi:hypothetical protein
MKLNNLLLMPPGGWRYYQPQTGFWMNGITFEQLLGRVDQHRKNNGIPHVSEGYATLALEVLDSICSALSPADQRLHCTDAPPAPWPTYLLPFKLLAKEGDRGLGDIVARTIGPVGGDAFKTWYKETFDKGCGCHERQDYLNAAYPLK